MSVFASSADEEAALAEAKADAIAAISAYVGHEPSKELQLIVNSSCANIEKAASIAEVEELSAKAYAALDQQIAYQEKLAKFEFYKAETISKAKVLLKENDSAACQQILEQYIIVVQSMSYDFGIDEAENRANVYAVLDACDAALEAQRTVDAAAAAENARLLAEAKVSAVSEIKAIAGDDTSAAMNAIVADYNNKINNAESEEEVKSILMEARPAVNKQYENDNAEHVIEEKQEVDEPEPEETYSNCPVIRFFQKIINGIKNMFK